MNKELQDKAWNCLPKEFREEVKKMYDAVSAWEKTAEVLETLFGKHNLTSDTTPQPDTSQKEPFKVGDKAVVKQGLGKFEVVKIVYYDAEEKTYRVEFENEDAVGNLWYSFKELEPYTKPQPKNLFSKNVENENHSGDTSQKTPNLRSNLRLQVATAAMQGILANPNIIMSCGGMEDNQEYITKHAVIYADALIAGINGKGE